MHIREIVVPFSEEEIERLTEIAAAEGGSIADFIRAYVFGSSRSDLAAMVARLEGERIRARGRGWDRD